MSKIKLQSCDNEVFEVDVAIAKKSITIKTMLEDLCNEEDDTNNEVVPLPNVNKNILAKIIEWAEHHKDDPEPTPEVDYEKELTNEDIPDWDKEFLKVDDEILFDVLLAANYLDVKGLLELACKTVALTLKGKTAEEVRQRYNIENDLVPESEVAGSSPEPPATGESSSEDQADTEAQAAATE